MSFDNAILGFLHDAPRSGYDLKKAFAESDLLYWSGNNNQVYTALLRLEKAGLVRSEIHVSESGPMRKEYSVTEAGRTALEDWVATRPELPQVRSPFLIQLTWGDELSPELLDTLLLRYERELRGYVALIHEKGRRQAERGEGSSRQQVLRRAIADRWVDIYQDEMEWVHNLRRELTGLDSGTH